MIEIKCGIEIHQQLDTHKLFCECPSVLRSDEPRFEVTRRLHAVRGETGEIDSAAKHEAMQDKEFVYQGYDTTCLVELDEEPPHLINPEALKIALHIALHLNCEIVPVAQIMRKTVVDGSNTSGFQRTVMIARNGYVETKHGKVGIDKIFLEEDAARIVEKKDDKAIYRLDRLGIPLVEIATMPDIKSPEQCKEVALFIGDVLRSCKVKRGIGTIRQDINISTPGHPRIEIKGFQDVKTFIITVEKEMLRQKKLVEIHEELRNKKARVIEKIIDLTNIFNKTECKLIKSAIEKKGKILGIRLEKFKGLLGKELYENRRFGTEISDYSKIAGVSGIIHSDEDLNKYHLSPDEIKKINEKLGIKNEDAFILIADNEEKARKALGLAIDRAKIQLTNPSVSEVRDPNPDGSSRFLRPMPGSARMYPETDHPILRISREIINEAKKTLPKLRSDIKGELKQKGLTDEMLKLLFEEGKIEEFEALLKIINDPNFIVKTMILIPREVATKEKIENIYDILTMDVIESVISAVKEGKIKKEDIKQVMEEVAKGKSFEDAIKLEKVDLSEVEGEIVKLVKEKPGLTIGGYMELVMQKFKGKVTGKDATDILNKILHK